MKNSGNPIEMDLKTRYVVKGVGQEKTIDSLIKIWTEGGKISRVEDRWDGEIPDGAIAKVGLCSSYLLVPGANVVMFRLSAASMPFPCQRWSACLRMLRRISRKATKSFYITRPSHLPSRLTLHA